MEYPLNFSIFHTLCLLKRPVSLKGSTHLMRLMGWCALKFDALNATSGRKSHAVTNSFIFLILSYRQHQLMRLMRLMALMALMRLYILMRWCALSREHLDASFEPRSWPTYLEWTPFLNHTSGWSDGDSPGIHPGIHPCFREPSFHRHQSTVPVSWYYFSLMGTYPLRFIVNTCILSSHVDRPIWSSPIG